MSRKRRKAAQEPILVEQAAGGAGRVFKVIFFLILLAGSTLWFPEQFYDGFETPKLFAVELLGSLTLAGWVLWLFVYKRDGVTAILPRPALPLVGLFALGLVSVAWSYDRWLAVERLFHVSTLAGTMFFAWFLYRDREIRAPLLFVAAVGSVIAGWGLLLDAVGPLREFIYPHFKEIWGGGRVVDNYRQLTSNQGNPNYLFHILVLTVPLTLGAAVQSLARSRTGNQARRVEMLKACLLLAGLLLHASCFTYAANRSGLVATAGAVVLFLIGLAVVRLRAVTRAAGRYWKQALALFILLVLAGGVFFRFTSAGAAAGNRISGVLSGGWENWQRRFATLRSTENIDVYSRVVFLETGAAMVADDPLLGKGIGQFVIQFPGYKTPEHWERFGLLPPDIKMWALIPKQTHNEYLQVLIELGAVGLALFLVFWAAFCLSTLKLLHLRRDDDAFYLVLGAAAGLAGVLANSLLTFPLQTVTSALLVWTSAGVLLAACAQAGSCGTVAIRIVPRRPPAALLLALTLAVAGFGVWGAQRILKAEHLFFMALKQHAHNLAYSIRTNKQAADMLPERFEMQYVEGWLGLLAGDTTLVRTYFERSVEVSPSFPPPYKHLASYYFNSGDYRRAEKDLRRYGEIYPRGIDDGYHLLLGQIIMKDSTRDRFAEISENLQASGNLPAALYLAEKFLDRHMPDSSLALLQAHRRGMRRNNEEFNRTYFLTAAAELARGDSTAARSVLDTLLHPRRREPPREGRYADYARQMEKMLQ